MAGGPDTLFEDVHGAGFRAVYDLENLDRSRFMIATGQSGNPLSHLYGNLTLRWRDGQTVSLAPDVIDAALVAALAAPPLNLRQGTFTRRTPQTLDWKTLRRSGVLADRKSVV